MDKIVFNIIYSVLMISSYFFGGKDNVSRRQYKISLLIFIVKEMPICVTDSAFFQIANRLALKLAESMGFRHHLQ